MKKKWIWNLQKKLSKSFAKWQENKKGKIKDLDLRITLIIEIGVALGRDIFKGLGLEKEKAV